MSHPLLKFGFRLSVLWAPLWAGVLCCAAAAATPYQAMSFSTWELSPEGAEVVVQIRARDLETLATEAPTSGPELVQSLPELLYMQNARGNPCKAQGPVTRLPAQAPWLMASYRVVCSDADTSDEALAHRTITSRLQPLLNQGHRHRLRIAPTLGAGFDATLDRQHPSLALSAAHSLGAGGIGSYVRQGLQFAWTDPQHIALLVGLWLLARTGAALVRLLVAFCVAYGAILVAGALGLVRFDVTQVAALTGFGVALPGAVHAFLRTRAYAIPAVLALGPLLLLVSESPSIPPLALIGLTLFIICHFALLTHVPQHVGLGPLALAITLGFGSIHGSRLAAHLTTLGLPPEPLQQALFGFQIGLFLASAALAAVPWALSLLLRRWSQGRPEQLLQEATAAALCGLGVFWFVTLSFG